MVKCASNRSDKTKIVYENSFDTLKTNSKTLSEWSQYCTKGITTQFKKQTAYSHYYEDNGKLKRDLSIETDICILRSYYRNNRKRHCIINTISTRSNNTINDSQNKSIGKLEDASACGDNFLENHLNIDITNMVVENLKKLLNEWIKRYLLDKKNTKQEIETVLDSILHQVNLTKSSSSYTSCTLDVEILSETLTENTNAVDTQEVYNNAFKHIRTSYLSIPLTNKKLKLVSTLSVPKNLSRPKRKIKKLRNRAKHHKNKIYFPMDSSELSNIFAISPKVLTEKCATYKEQSVEVNNHCTFDFEKKSQYDIYHVKDSNKNFYTEINPLKNEDDNAEDYTNLKQKYYGKNIEHKEIDASDYNNQMLKTSKVHQNRSVNMKNSKRKPPESKARKNRAYPSFQYVKSNKKYSVNTANTHSKKSDILQSLQHIIKCIEKSKNVMKVDVKLNVFPIVKEDKKSIPNHSKTNKTKNTSHLFHKVEPTFTCTKFNKKHNVKRLHKCTSNKVHTNFPLCGSGFEKTKYLINRQTSTSNIHEYESNIKLKNFNNRGTCTSKCFEIKNEIGEIGSLIKYINNLAKNIHQDSIVVDKIHSKILYITPVTLEVKQEDENPHCFKTKKNITSPIKSTEPQCKSCNTRTHLIPGHELSMELRDYIEFNSDQDKKSTSYRIIDSECILRVTDMTTVPCDFPRQIANEEMKWSLHKSKSLIELTSEQDTGNILTFYCDDLILPHHHGCKMQSVPCSSKICHNSTAYPIDSCIANTCSYNYVEECYNTKNSQSRLSCEYNPIKETLENHHTCSSVCVNMEDERLCENKLVLCKREMSFNEGCFYCVLLWIPSLIILWLLYVNIIRDRIKPLQNLGEPNTELNTTHNSIMLHDLGF
ncbi:uncharacterized protein LOC126975590 isoform X1 [Leptidea sinapis]|uniref:uncharacterized protein LOC126975590 isoform X1 n=1 Tax=Leptidea sinapis TaxID=189913 RepID=UPI0021275DDF|nr:uncharacterized protein LOC126975590 isoform X1 [Leptidea sinapis]